MNHNIPVQTIKSVKCVEYYDKTVKLIATVIEYNRYNTMEKGARFHKGPFYIKSIKTLYEKSVMR